MLIFLLGSGALALYQVKAIDDQLEDTTRTIDQMDGKVKRAEYEKSKFFAITRDVLNLAPKDPNAESIVADFKLQQLQTKMPELLAQSASPDAAATNASSEQPVSATNSVPVEPSQATNAAPLNSFSPTAK